MKVFSKGINHNKSTPNLNILTASTQHNTTIKSKNTNKLKTFKQIITQNMHNPGNKVQP